MNRYVYSFIPIGVALVAGGIQTAIIGYSFGADQWYIAALLIVCVWLTVSMDAAAFHHSALHGATGMQKTFLAISAVSLVLVLSVDLVWMFAPQAFNTTDAIIRDLSYATGVNLAVSTFCLLAWIFFSQDHKDEREAAQMESDTRREQRLAWLQSGEAKKFFGDEVRIEHIERIAKRRKRTAFAIAEESKIIDQSQSIQPTRGLSESKSLAADAAALPPQGVRVATLDASIPAPVLVARKANADTWANYPPPTDDESAIDLLKRFPVKDWNSVYLTAFQKARECGVPFVDAWVEIHQLCLAHLIDGNPKRAIETFNTSNVARRAYIELKLPKA